MYRWADAKELRLPMVFFSFVVILRGLKTAALQRYQQEYVILFKPQRCAIDKDEVGPILYLGVVNQYPSAGRHRLWSLLVNLTRAQKDVSVEICLAGCVTNVEPYIPLIRGAGLLVRPSKDTLNVCHFLSKMSDLEEGIKDVVHIFHHFNSSSQDLILGEALRPLIQTDLLLDEAEILFVLYRVSSLHCFHPDE